MSRRSPGAGGGGREVELRVFETLEDASLAAAELLTADDRHIALSGGSTPRRAYELAARLRPDWSGVELWWADERCVPPDDPRSNFRLVGEALLQGVTVPPRAVHRILGELEPSEAARRYDEELDGVLLDVALLGIGADGHTASLFAQDEALEERERLALAVERPDVARVTMTPPLLRATQHVVFLAVGAEKADAVRRAFGAPPSAETPASLIRGRRTTAILDQASATRL